MSALDLEKELVTAIAAVRSAVDVCRRVQRDLINSATLEKKDKSPVTVADFASQALICSALAAGSSVRAVVGEENARALRKPENAEVRAKVVEQVRSVRGADVGETQALDWIDLGGVTPDASTPVYWTLDPIDGTKGFLRGEHYAIALGLLHEGRVVVGVLGCPNLDGPDGRPGALLAAARGHGAFSLPLSDAGGAARRAVRVDDVSDPARARFCESVESGHSDQDESARIAHALGITAEPVRVDSQTKYAIVARGDASIYLRLPTSEEYREKIWDHAAGSIVVEEAGGRVSDCSGRPLDFSQGRRLERNRGVVATSGRIHDAVLRALESNL